MECTQHYKILVHKCTWCSQEICEECVNDARGHKLCPTCFVKLSKSGRLRRKDKDRSKNVDPTLTQEQINEGKRIIQKEKPKPRVRNVPDWPTLK